MMKPGRTLDYERKKSWVVILAMLLLAATVAHLLHSSEGPDEVSPPPEIFAEMAQEDGPGSITRALVRYATENNFSNDHPIYSPFVSRLTDLIWHYSNEIGEPPSTILGIMFVEDPALDTMAVSPAGALGLMQIMPFHRGNWGCPEGPLTNVEVNICHGARIWQRYRDMEYAEARVEALLRYNGCVRTPGCERYSTWVEEKVDLARDLGTY